MLERLHAAGKIPVPTVKRCLDFKGVDVVVLNCGSALQAVFAGHV